MAEFKPPIWRLAFPDYSRLSGSSTATLGRPHVLHALQNDCTGGSACATSAHMQSPAAPYRARGEVTSGGGCGCIIPWAATNSRAGARMDGHLRAKTTPPARLAMPPSATVIGAPICCAIFPAASEPNGDIPRNIIE